MGIYLFRSYFGAFSGLARNSVHVVAYGDYGPASVARAAMRGSKILWIST